MVINIPSESEASDATVISGFPIDEEEEIQFPKVQQPWIDPMDRTQKQQAAVAPEKEPRQPDETQLAEVSKTPTPQQRKLKAMTALDEQGKTHIGEKE